MILTYEFTFKPSDVSECVPPSPQVGRLPPGRPGRCVEGGWKLEARCCGNCILVTGLTPERWWMKLMPTGRYSSFCQRENTPEWHHRHFRRRRSHYRQQGAQQSSASRVTPQDVLNMKTEPLVQTWCVLTNQVIFAPEPHSLNTELWKLTNRKFNIKKHEAVT